MFSEGPDPAVLIDRRASQYNTKLYSQFGYDIHFRKAPVYSEVIKLPLHLVLTHYRVPRIRNPTAPSIPGRHQRVETQFSRGSPLSDAHLCPLSRGSACIPGSRESILRCLSLTGLLGDFGEA
jgi:hypothetical protein